MLIRRVIQRGLQHKRHREGTRDWVKERMYRIGPDREIARAGRAAVTSLVRGCEKEVAESEGFVCSRDSILCLQGVSGDVMFFERF